MTKAQPDKTIEAVNAEIAAIEQEAANKRAHLHALQEAENERRSVLGKLLQERLRLQEVISRNASCIAAHQADADEFERMCDCFFASESGNQSRMYNFLHSDFPLSLAERAVAILSPRLAKTKEQLARLDVKILAEAKDKSLHALLPEDFVK